jgi:cathepsin C
MVYDEGFEITYKNVKYFAFSKYEPLEGKRADSICDKTLIGWYNNQHSNERGCYRAEKSTEV